MSMIYLWHPSVGGDGTVLDLILTRGDSDQIGGGSERFISAVTNDLGITAMPVKWAIKPYRCNFYSEYWMEEGWKSKWDLIWRVTVHFKSPVSVQPLKMGYKGIDDIDDYSPLVESYKYEPIGCLVVGVFASEEKAKAVARNILTDGDLAAARSAAAAPDPLVQVVRVKPEEFHLRAAIGSGEKEFFTGDYPVMVISLLEASGAITHVES